MMLSNFDSSTYTHPYFSYLHRYEQFLFNFRNHHFTLITYPIEICRI